MKKFLFTLVALLTAGSMFAYEYCYIEDQDLTGQTGEVELTVAAHFDYAVSAFQVDFTFPAGMEMVDLIQGADTKIDYINARGRAATSNPLFIADFEHNNFMCAQAETGYYNVDGAWVSHNVVKWAPGDYEEMAILVVELSDEFAGGKITLVTQPSCDSGVPDPRPEYPNCEENQMNTEETNVGPQETPTPDADEPVITFTPVAAGVTVDIENFTEFTITINEQPVTVTAEMLPYLIEAEYDVTKVIVVSATNAPAGYNPASNSDSYTLQPKQKEQNSKPSVTYSYDPETGELNVWAYGCTEENVTYTLYCDGVAYTGTMPITVVAEEGYNHVWTATAVSPTTTVSELSDECPIVIDPVTPPTITDDPEIDVQTDPETGIVTITVTGEGTVTAKVTTGAGTTNYTDEDGDGEIVIILYPGEEEDWANVYATATLPGDNVVPGEAQETMIYIAAKTAKPVITYDEDTYTVTVTGNGIINVLIEGYGDGDVITYTGESPYTYTFEPGEYEQEVTVSATAKEEGKVVSDPALKDIYVPEYVPTLLTGEIQFGAVNQANGQFTVTYTGDEANVVITLNNDQITVVAGKATTTTFQLPAYGSYPVVATAKAVGYDNEVTGEATLVWENPTPELPAVPEITINMDDNNVYVGATTQEGCTTTLYAVTYDDDNNEILTPINNPQTYARGVENYEVKVKAVAENAAGETWSEVITIPVPSKTTGIDEMMGGKTIANVRYFNMAGQEMTEANGVTIVVTTYTDGTTSAVKVMK